MITENKVVSMNYTLKDDAGQVLDASNGEPLSYLQGHGNIIPGLERELAGLKPGDSKHVTVQPEEAYGQYNPELKFELPMEQFGGDKPEPGAMVQLQSPAGALMATIEKVDASMVTLDANHPLAGQQLHFDVEITEVRDATPEEIQHGHPHGPNGHHH